MHLTPMLAALLACAQPPPAEREAAQEPTPSEPAVRVEVPAHAAEATLPTPFTLRQMKAGWVPGVRVRFRMEVTGQPTTLHDWEVRSNPDADHVETAVTVRREDDGTALAPTTARVMSYEELRQHAAFPSSRATMEQARVAGPDGPLPGRRYQVRSADDPGQVVTLEFADALPGPPVLMQTREAGEVVQSMRMLTRSGGPTAPRP